LSRLESCLARHADVEDCEVDVVFERAFDRFLAVGDLGDDVQVWFGAWEKP
jgi:hypothetical protein